MTTLPLGPAGVELEPHERYVPGSHWRNAKDELEAAKLGMWLFLATEVLLFGGFFCAYAFFRYLYPHDWHEASRYYLSWQIGAANTAVLLLSSFTIVLAIRGAQTNRKGMILLNLAITQLCAAFFLVVKIGWEYMPKIQKGELPGGFFTYPHPHGDYDHIFMSVYWISTATHGFHVFIGMIVIAWAMWKAAAGHYGPKHYTSLENVGLYWHLVDVIWIFLFPLLYLV
ncbi:MAG: cytochrome c oxidase subunit 3 [Planctomycetota bacterium]|nr:cytochrome c oxidase subunit 3 [Planctomycetota bacterium]